MNASNITSKHITGLNLTTPKQVSPTESHGGKTKPYVKAHISNQTNALKQELNNWIDTRVRTIFDETFVFTRFHSFYYSHIYRNASHFASHLNLGQL